MSPAATPRLGQGGWVVVSDLDGCLLDTETYAWTDARPARDELSRSRVPLVLCSGKTRMEMQALARELDLAHPFIVENGGAIVFPAGSFEGDVPGARSLEDLLALGPPRRALPRIGANAEEGRP